MRSEAAQQRIPSCTACYFDAPQRIVAAPPPGNGILLRFMNDQQWCVLWHLYVEKSGAHAVLASEVAFDLDAEEDDEEAPKPTLVLCGSSFEEFLYRIWIENSAWFALVEGHRDLSAREKAYLEHYRRGLTRAPSG
jgi:hypothetical protein